MKIIYEKQISLLNKNIISYICLVHFWINVKTKMNCKTESYFLIMLIMFNYGGRIWIRDGPRVENHCKKKLFNLSYR